MNCMYICMYGVRASPGDSVSLLSNQHKAKPCMYMQPEEGLTRDHSDCNSPTVAAHQK